MADLDWADEADKIDKSLKDVSVKTSGEVAPDVDGSVTVAEASLLTKILRQKLIETKSILEVQRSDPTSPLYSVKSFQQLPLCKELLEGIFAMGFDKPSKIQEVALPILVADPPQNLIAQSQSGTGKTAAFVLSMLTRVDPNKQFPQAICLSPTFDLAKQTGKVLEQMGKYLPQVKVIYAIKGQRLPKQHKISEQIVIGTPGTMMDWVLKFKYFDASKVRLFILDEADVMIATQGHQDQTLRIHNALNQSCQKGLFSATYDDSVMAFAKKIIPQPVVLRLKKEEQSLDNIKQFYVRCNDEEDKFLSLANIYGTITVGQAMVFCQTRKSANNLAAKLVKGGQAVGLLTGEMETEQRAAVLDRFREGKEKILISTNVMARGIDIEQVTLVVNYDLPFDVHTKEPDYETYLHRIGRTGRFGNVGLAINLIDGERSYQNLLKIQSYFGRKIDELCANDPDAIEQAVGEHSQK